MLTLIGYVSVCILLGVLNNYALPKYKWLIFALVVICGIVLNSLNGVDIQKDGILRTIWMVITEGTFWYLLFSIVTGGIPFLLGRIGYERLRRNQRKA